MKYLSLIAILLSTFFISKAQVLTLDQLIALKSKNLETVEEFLTTRNWSFSEASEATDTDCEVAEFVYGQSDIDENKAVAFLKYVKCTLNNRVFYQFQNKQSYLSILSRLKQLNFKSSLSTIENGKIVKTYSTNRLTVRVTTATTENSYGGKITTYVISVFNKSDYDSLTE